MFDAWHQWAEKQKTPQEKSADLKGKTDWEMAKLGNLNAPEWIKYDFKNLEEFYKHYKWITTEVDE